MTQAIMQTAIEAMKAMVQAMIELMGHKKGQQGNSHSSENRCQEKGTITEAANI